MSRLTARAGHGALGKARLLAGAIACLSIGGQASQIGNIAHGPAWHTMSRAAVVALVAIVAVTWWRGRTLFFDPFVVPVLLVMVGSGLADSINTTGPCIVVMVAQSLYGSHRSWLIRSLGAIAALPISVALSPYALTRPVEWNSATVLPIIPQLVLITIVIRAMYVAMIRQEQSSIRANVLADTGRRLLAITDVEQARAIGRDSVTQLAATAPGVAMAVLVRQADGAVVVASAGFGAPVNGTRVPLPALSVFADSDVELAPPEPLLAHVPHVRHWRADRITANGIELFVLVGAAHRVPSDLMAAFVDLGNQVSLAEAGCLLHSELNQRANHDHLTSLPTRGLFFQHLTEAVDAAAGGVALLNIDLDDFKKVNDTYGHGAGDELLRVIATRIEEAAGPHGVAARFGGDEFAVLLTGTSGPGEAIDVADRICRRIVEPVPLTAAVVSVGASIGVAVAEPELTAGDLLRCADIAMYSAKARGKSRVELFSAEQHGSIVYNRMLDEHFPEAIGRDEIALRYRPIVDLGTGRCQGVEAVASWRHPVLGRIEPADLWAVAERVGRTVQLGTHVLAEACRHIAGWAHHPSAGELRVSVDVHNSHLTRADFADTLSGILRDAGLAPGRLILDIVESEQMDHPTAREQLRRVAEEGVGIALDDFGIGYGSLASLRSFPIDQIKVAPSLLRTGDLAVLQLVASVGRLLGAETVAQGLTDTDAATGAYGAGARLGQGEVFGIPMEADHVVEWLSARAAAPAATETAELAVPPARH